MKTRLVLTTAGILLSLLATTAEARERSRSGSATGPQGRSLHRDISTQSSVGAGNGSFQRHSDVQGGAGRGYSRDAGGSCAEGSGCSRSVGGTTNSGKTWSRDGSIVRNEDGSLSRNSTATGPNGETTSRETTIHPVSQESH